MRSSSLAVGVFAIAAAGLVQCFGPTEIEVVLSTNVPCTSVINSAIALGPPGDDSRGVVGTASSCSADGGIGTLYVGPSGGIGDEIEIRATLGVSKAADACTAPDFTGCIVARRQLRFTPHTRLVLPIEFDQDCLGQPCGPNTTCVDGACVDAGVPPCPEDICTLGDGGAAEAGPTPDGGACTPIGPLNVAGIGFAPRLHVLRLPSGFAVAWEDAPPSGARNLVVSVIDLAGNVAKAVTLGSVKSSSDGFSDVGTDGTSFAAARLVSGSLSTLLVPIQGGTATSTNATVTLGSLSTRGFLATSPQTFAFVGGDPSGTGVDAVSWNVALSQFQPSTPDTTDLGNPAELTASNGLTFISYAKNDGTCTILTCTGSFPSGACTPAAVQSCASVHAGATASQNVILAVRASNGFVTTYNASNTGLPGFFASSAPEGVLVVPAGGDDVREVWATGQELDTVFVASNGVVIGLPRTVVPSNQTTLDDFDAIGGLSSNEWAYTYYDGATGQIVFARECP